MEMNDSKLSSTPIAYEGEIRLSIAIKIQYDGVLIKGNYVC